jgi:hypothetical protein
MFPESRLARSLNFEPDNALSAKQRDPFRAWIVPDHLQSELGTPNLRIQAGTVWRV